MEGMSQGATPIDPNELILRRIPAREGYYEPRKVPPVSKGAFQPSGRDIDGLSFNLEREVSAETLAMSGTVGTPYAVARLRAGDLYALGLTLVPDQQPGDLPGHLIGLPLRKKVRSMTEFPVRHFLSDEAVAHVGEGLLSRTLPREEWTHEAHLAATTYLVLKHPEIDLDAEIRSIISRYNESVGGVNSDTEGYHDTITRAFLRGIRLFLEEADRSRPIHELVNELLMSPMGRRDWPLRFWSKERLMSVEARRGWVEPDLAAMP